MHAHFTPGPLVAKARAEYPLQEIHAAGAAVTQGRTDGRTAMMPYPQTAMWCRQALEPWVARGFFFIELLKYSTHMGEAPAGKPKYKMALNLANLVKN